MKQFRVGIIGATGMVGQRFATLLEHHPWFMSRRWRRAPVRLAKRMEREAVGRPLADADAYAGIDEEYGHL